MKILFTSDWHADWISHGIRRHDEVRRAGDYILETAAKQNISMFVNLGDLTNPTNGAETIRAITYAVEFAMSFNNPNVWIAGNHDVIEDSLGDTTLLPLSSLPHTHVIQRPQAINILDKVVVLGLPYPAITSPYDPKELDYERMIKGAGWTDQPIIVAAHLTKIPGVKYGEETKEMGRGRDVEFPVEKIKKLRSLSATPKLFVFNGHFHQRQTLDFGEFVLEIPGSLIRLTFAEENHKPRFLIVEV